MRVFEQTIKTTVDDVYHDLTEEGLLNIHKDYEVVDFRIPTEKDKFFTVDGNVAQGPNGNNNTSPRLIVRKIRNWTRTFTVTLKDVYGSVVDKPRFKQLEINAIDFRPPKRGEKFIFLEGYMGVANSDYGLDGTRLILPNE